ncbi:hypothetical protein CL629_03420 [bacterium]|nr:hypothetical protein [bacterium]|tara:strand:- start:13147 stop:14475 length:1329 start_codon:yes stop_codon:yes gene_type:complete
MGFFEDFKRSGGQDAINRINKNRQRRFNEDKATGVVIGEIEKTKDFRHKIQSYNQQIDIAERSGDVRRADRLKKAKGMAAEGKTEWKTFNDVSSRIFSGNTKKGDIEKFMSSWQILRGRDPEVREIVDKYARELRDPEVDAMLAKYQRADTDRFLKLKNDEAKTIINNLRTNAKIIQESAGSFRDKSGRLRAPIVSLINKAKESMTKANISEAEQKNLIRGAGLERLADTRAFEASGRAEQRDKDKTVSSGLGLAWQKADVESKLIDLEEKKRLATTEKKAERAGKEKDEAAAAKDVAAVKKQKRIEFLEDAATKQRKKGRQLAFETRKLQKEIASVNKQIAEKKLAKGEKESTFDKKQKSRLDGIRKELADIAVRQHDLVKKKKDMKPEEYETAQVDLNAKAAGLLLEIEKIKAAKGEEEEVETIVAGQQPDKPITDFIGK